MDDLEHSFPSFPLKSMKIYFGFAQLIEFDFVLDDSFLLCVAKLLPLCIFGFCDILFQIADFAATFAFSVQRKSHRA